MYNKAYYALIENTLKLNNINNYLDCFLPFKKTFVVIEWMILFLR